MKSLIFNTTLVSLFSLIAAAAGAQAFAATDLEKYLSVPFEALSNPFTTLNDQTLPESTETALRAFLLKCFIRPVNGIFWGELKITSECASSVKYSVADHTSNGNPILSPVVEIHTGKLQFTAVSWDGDNSDHGDELALGIYDTHGNRVAIYKSLYMEGNTFDALAGAVGVNADITKVTDTSLKF